MLPTVPVCHPPFHSTIITLQFIIAHTLCMNEMTTITAHRLTALHIYSVTPRSAEFIYLFLQFSGLNSQN